MILWRSIFRSMIICSNCTWWAKGYTMRTPSPRVLTLRYVNDVNLAKVIDLIRRLWLVPCPQINGPGTSVPNSLILCQYIHCLSPFTHVSFFGISSSARLLPSFPLYFRFDRFPPSLRPIINNSSMDNSGRHTVQCWCVHYICLHVGYTRNVLQSMY